MGACLLLYKNFNSLSVLFQSREAGACGIWVPLAEVMRWAFSGNLRLNFLFYLVPVFNFVSYDFDVASLLVSLSPINTSVFY